MSRSLGAAISKEFKMSMNKAERSHVEHLERVVEHLREIIKTLQGSSHPVDNFSVPDLSGTRPYDWLPSPYDRARFDLNDGWTHHWIEFQVDRKNPMGRNKPHIEIRGGASLVVYPVVTNVVHVSVDDSHTK